MLAWFAAYVGYRSQIDPATTLIEAEAGFVGGLGLPIELSWLVGGLLAGGVAYLIGNVCLGLRTDYLAIATIGIAEIIRAFLKNMDWLTRGTLTVSPLPWPVPTALETGISNSDLALIVSRSLFLGVTIIATAILFVLLQRAYGGAWGRMMRAIRDNHVAAESMGKNVKGRQVELFVLGAVLMGIGGALLTTYVQIYDPGGYQPINHTFIVWVMVIIGGAGNNLGALFGGVLIIIAWNMSAPCHAAPLPLARRRHAGGRPRRHLRCRFARPADARLRPRPGHRAGAALRAQGPDPGAHPPPRGVGFGGRPPPPSSGCV